MGGASSWLGVPTKAEWEDYDQGTILAEFEKGPIAHNKSTGKTIAINYSNGDKTLQYMHEEMINNSNSKHTEEMKELNHKKKWLDALSKWIKLVNDKSEWDHKRDIEKLCGCLKSKNGNRRDPINNYSFPIRGDYKHEYFYDIWSNIHYGYVGNAAGFSKSILTAGSTVNDLMKLNLDGNDKNAVELGFKLWNDYGSNLTVEQLRTNIINNNGLSREDLKNGE